MRREQVLAVTQEPQPTLKTLSLGAGVQSSAIALMAAAGEIDPPDCAIFADTGWETPGTYEWLDKLDRLCPFPIHRVSERSIKDDLTKQEGRYVAVPFFLSGGGLGRRQCTHEYKLKPISRKLRQLLSKGPRDRIAPGTVQNWLGISVDEAHRMKDSRVKWQINHFPLIDLRMSRADCSAWLKRAGHGSPPKSACVCCPFRSPEMWREIRADNEIWREVTEVDRKIRNGGTIQASQQQQYMHRQLVPLDQADIDLEHKNQPDLFGNECDGICNT